jgi:hypothetical protein
LSVVYAPIVTQDPADDTLLAGQPATFTAAATNGNPVGVTVQWELSTNGGTTWTPLSPGGLYGNSVNSDTLVIAAVSSSMNDYEYQAMFSNPTGLSSTSTPATLNVAFAPTVSRNPSNTTVNTGGNASFTATATPGDPAVTTVQWEVSTNGGVTYSPIPTGTSTYGSSVTTDTLTLATVTTAMNGYMYVAVFSNASGLSDQTTAAMLVVDYPPTVTTNPYNATVATGTSLTFTAGATGGNPSTLTVQWQVSTNGGASYTNVTNGAGGYSGASTNVLGVTASAAMNGDYYRAVYSNGTGLTADTAPAMLTVISAPTITSNPVNETINAGGSSTFSASATAGGPTQVSVIWEVSTDGGATFTPLQAGGVYGNSVTSTTLTITNAPYTLNQNQYEAVFATVSGMDSVTTAATLTVKYAPVVVTSPASVGVGVAGTAVFTAVGSGNPDITGVQWQVSTNGGKTFTNVPSSSSLYTTSSSPTLPAPYATASLTVSDVPLSMSGYEYRAVFSSGVKTVTTSAGTLNVNSAPTVSKQPASTTVNVIGSALPSASFTATATGGYPAVSVVQWQVYSGGTWTPITAGGNYSISLSGGTSTLIVYGVDASLSGTQYQAIFSNGAGFTATTSAATLTVETGPAVTSPPTSMTINAGGAATFSVVGTGSPTPTVQWQVSTNGGKTFSNLAKGSYYGTSVTSPTLTITGATAAMSGYEYRAVLSSKLYGMTSATTAASTAATLTVNAPVKISGIKAATTIAPTKTTDPFSTIVLTSQGAAEPQNITITLSNPSSGTLGNLGGGTYDPMSGTYTLMGVTVAQAQAALRALVFTPSGTASSTTFSIAIGDLGGTATNTSTKVTVS